MKFKAIAFSCALISITSATGVRASSYSEGMYRRAILDGDSTSPIYLLFTLHDAKTGKDRVVCTLGSGLVGAIHYGRHLDFDQASHKKAKSFALTRPHRFTFTNRDAIRVIEPHYSEAMLAEYRNRFAKMSRSQLIAAVDQHELKRLCDGGSASKWRACQAALAHVLLERGILVGSGDQTGSLFVERMFYWW